MKIQIQELSVYEVTWGVSIEERLSKALSPRNASLFKSKEDEEKLAQENEVRQPRDMKRPRENNGPIAK